VIEWADAAGCALLNCSSTRCRGRDLIVFFGANRIAAIEAMADARAGEVVQRSGMIRPRERRPRLVTFTVAPDPEQDRSLKWVFEVPGALS
jgi:hypothetical protein